MRDLPTTTTQPDTCPPWCLRKHCDGPAPLHMAADRHMTYLAEGDGYPMQIQVELLRADWPGDRGTPVITVGARHEGERLWDGLHPDDPLSADDAERLAELLRQAAADARRTRPTLQPTSAPTPHVRRRTGFDSPFTVNKTREFTGPQVARVLWSEFWHGSRLAVLDVLDERQYLIVCRWAVDVLLRHITPEGYPANGAEDLSWEQLRAEEARATGAVVDLDQLCLDCDRPFNPNYSPHIDRCAGCAEDHDAENGDDR